MGGDVRLPLALGPAALPVRKATLQDQVGAVEGHVEHFTFREFDRSVGLMSKGPERSEAPLQSRETPIALAVTALARGRGTSPAATQERLKAREAPAQRRLRIRAR